MQIYLQRISIIIENIIFALKESKIRKDE